MSLSLKEELGHLDGTPEKRLFWSIISDYDIPTALCELIDNAVDMWWPHEKSRSLLVTADLDVERQVITVADNAGGVAVGGLRYLVSPGASSNDAADPTIGVFGVGGKRAVVALSENVTIKTRHAKEATYQIDVTSDWIASESWGIPYYRAPDIASGTTEIAMNTLRRPLTIRDVNDFRLQLGAVYCQFLSSPRLGIRLNGTPILPLSFAHWAFPEAHPPMRTKFAVSVPGEGVVDAVVTGGLTFDRDPDNENYGVYFYCNGRLVAKHLKSREVGYFGGAAGVPHPDASLARVVVELDGPAKLMPWNSSKTGVNASHPVFQAVRGVQHQMLTHFSSLSRRLKHDWDHAVFPHQSGEIVEVEATDSHEALKTYLPALPRINKSRTEQLVARNRKNIERQPWTLGLVEAMAMVDLVARQRLQTRNRIALLLLDSNLEIALKEFIVHRNDLFPPRVYDDAAIKKLFARREQVLAEVTRHAKINPALLDRVRHYYLMRNKLIHERATVGVADDDIKNFRDVIQQVLQILFGLKVGRA